MHTEPTRQLAWGERRDGIIQCVALLRALILVSVAFGAASCGRENATEPTPPREGPFVLADLSWDISPNGQTVVYDHLESHDQPTGIYTTDTTQSAVPQFLMPYEAFSLRYSPDGRYLALVRSIDGLDIWIRDLTDGSERRVTFTHGNATDPDWDPSGRYIVYERPFLRYGAADTTSGLFLLDTQTLADHHLRHTGLPTYGGDARWSPDSQTIVFTYGSPEHLYRIGADGTGYRDLTAGSTRSCEHPAWIQGGQRIVYEAYGSSGWIHETRVVNADGTGDQRYPIELRPYGYRSSLSRDGRFFVYCDLDSTRKHFVLFLKSAIAGTGPSSRQLTAYIPPDSATVSNVSRK